MGAPTYARRIGLLREEGPPNYGRSYTTSDTRSSRAQFESHQKQTRFQKFLFLYYLLQLGWGFPEGRLPGRSEHPRNSGTSATYSKIRESHTAEEKLRGQEGRRIRRTTSERKKEHEKANDEIPTRFRGSPSGSRSARSFAFAGEGASGRITTRR